MKPETIEYIAKMLVEDRDRASDRLGDLIRIHDDPAHHLRAMDAIDDLKKKENMLDDFQEWEERQRVTEVKDK